MKGKEKCPVCKEYPGGGHPVLLAVCYGPTQNVMGTKIQKYRQLLGRARKTP